MSEKVYVIGANSRGQCGVNSAQNLAQLTDFNAANPNLSSNIKYIYNGNGYTIYCDHKNNLYTSGDNKHYSCCINEKMEHISTLKEIDYFSKKTETMNNSKPKNSKNKRKTKKRKPAKTDEKDNKKMKIKKICVSVSGYCSFFVSENNKVYGNGNNRRYELGYETKPNVWWAKGFKYKCEPKRITGMVKNVIDIKTSCNYSIALRMSDKQIMFLFCNRNRYGRGVQLHDDVFQLIIAYVGTLSDTDCAVFMAGNGRVGWIPVRKFKRKSIIKIDCGVEHSLVLEENGVLWSWGNNRYLQCGAVWSWTGDQTLKSIKPAMEITYFKDNNIKIKEIKCGWNHNLVMDSRNKVYAFGRNNFGQCGYDADANDVSGVRLIDAFKECEIKEIACGSNHSYVQTVDGKHYLFGKNVQNQCVTNDGRQAVVKPFCIDDVIKQETKGTIKKVTLGVDNTQIIVSI